MKKKILLSFICVFAGALSALAAARVPYALYSQGHTMLTFYYGEMPEDGYYISAQYEPGWHADGSCSEVTHVVFDSSFAQARVTSTKDWFYDMRNLVSITGLEYLKTEYVTDMSRMFSYCTRLTTLDLRDLNTDRVTDMSFMFDCASSLTSVDLSNFNTSNVNYMQCMFKYCKELSTLDLSNFNTSSVINMDYMFQNCEKLKRLDLSTFNTENVKSMQYMFYSCKALSNLNVSNFNTSKVTNMWSMFHSCTSLTSLNLSSFNTQRVTNMSAMFYDCAKLVTIYVGEEWSNAAVTSGRETFRYCTNIKGGAGTTYDENNIGSSYAHIDGGTSNPGYLTGVQPVVAYDASTKTLTFYCDGEAHTGDVGPLPYYNTSQPWWVQDTNVSANVQKVVFHPSFAHVHPTSGYYWFAGMSNLTSFEGLKYFNTDEMVNMQSMFRNCSKLTSIEGIEYLNTSKVTNMYCMFMGCTNLANLDLRSFDTGKVTHMG
ncbi:MAG: BspA family leucine-rich repeat surface protein [Muribaculaceae bacterium]|nr:BspA family leucine-rich repeat surface protein [Muribaculaceae bacterium]